MQVFYFVINLLKIATIQLKKEEWANQLYLRVLFLKISTISIPNLISIESLEKLHSNHSPEDWYWFGISKTSLRDYSIPSPLYVECLKLISSKDLDLDRILFLFPKYIPTNLVVQILKESRFEKVRENKGFMFELCRLNKDYITENDLYKLIPLDVEKSLNNQNNLYHWINYLNKLQQSDPFDIRLSEWFNLLLIQGIAKSLKNIDKEFTSTKVFLHPANIILPTEYYINSFFKGNSWIDCKKKIQESKIDFIDSGIKEDIKLFQSQENIDFQKYMEARLFGILLLSLCTRTLNLPSIWNLPLLSEVYENRILSKLSHNPLSSWTTAIIYACLSGRSKESFWQLIWDVKNNEDDDDTVFEQLQIRSIDELIVQIDNALEILERHQVSVFNHEPRQLIPIYLEQLNQKDFSKLKTTMA